MTVSRSLLVGILALLAFTAEAAEVAEIHGVGESFPHEVYDEALFLFRILESQVHIDYTPLSGEHGKCRMMDWEAECGYHCHCAGAGNCSECGSDGDDHHTPTQIDYATTATILEPGEYAAYPDLQLYPTLAFAVVPIYHLSEIGNHTLVLSAPVLARIYRGNITHWNDPAIAALNTDCVHLLPNDEIHPFTYDRHDGLIETFTAALSDADAEFAGEVGVTSRPEWTVPEACHVNVIGCVINTPHSLSFVAEVDAHNLAAHVDLDHDLVAAQANMLDSNGFVVQPTVLAVELAVDDLGDQFGNNGDDPRHLTASLVNSQTPGAWPMVGYNYVLLHKNTTDEGTHCQQMELLLEFWDFFFHDPEIRVLAHEHQFVTLPDRIRELVIERMMADIHCGDTNLQLFPFPIQTRLPLAALLEPVRLESLAFQETHRDLIPDLNLDVELMSSEDAYDFETLADHSTDFGFSVMRSGFWGDHEVPHSDDTLVAFPFAAFGWAVMYNLCDVTASEIADCPMLEHMGEVVLDVQTLALILDGTIQFWNDSRIVEENTFLASFSHPITLFNTPLDREENRMFVSLLDEDTGSFTFAGLTDANTMPTDLVVRDQVYATIGALAVQVDYGDFDPDLKAFAKIHKTGVKTVELSPDSVQACAADTYHKETGTYFGIHHSPNPECYPLSAALVLTARRDHEGDCDRLDGQVRTAQFLRGLFSTEQDFASALEQEHGFTALFNLEEVNEGIQDHLNELFCNGERILDLAVNHNYLPAEMQEIMYGICGVFVLIAMVTLAWIKTNRRSGLIRTAQPTFLYLMILGSILTTLTLIPMSLDDHTHPKEELDAACQIQPYLYFVGTWLIFSGLVVKEYRVRKLFVNRHLKRVVVKVRHLLPVVMIGVVLNFSIVGAWHGTNPLTWKRVITKRDEFGYPTESYGVCSSDNLGFWLLPLMSIQIGSFIVGNVLAYQVRSIKTRFSEGKWLTTALVNQAQVAMFAIPLAVLVHDTSVELFMVKALIVILQGVGVFCLIMLPKVFAAYEGKKNINFMFGDISDSSDLIHEDRNASHYQAGRPRDTSMVMRKEVSVAMTVKESHSHLLNNIVAVPVEPVPQDGPRSAPVPRKNRTSSPHLAVRSSRHPNAGINNNGQNYQITSTFSPHCSLTIGQELGLQVQHSSMSSPPGSEELPRKKPTPEIDVTAYTKKEAPRRSGVLCCQSAEVQKDVQQNRDVEAALHKAKRADLDTVKLLLLGAGESGKSTIFKQMRILYDYNSITAGERTKFTALVHENTVRWMQKLLRECSQESVGAQEAMSLVMGLGKGATVDAEVAQAIRKLWVDPHVTATWKVRNMMQIADSLKYFVDNIERISEPGYLATPTDHLFVRVRSTGVVNSKYKINGVNFDFYDVGGQRNERRKWIHCFEDVHAVIFVAALSEYDQMLFEDEVTNRMLEALELFDEVCALKYFKDTDIILFLNKYDLFVDKLPQSPLKQVVVKEQIGGEQVATRPWHDYEGANDPESARRYFRERFVARNRVKGRRIYSHVTTATDTGNIKFVFEACQNIVLGRNIDESGF